MKDLEIANEYKKINIIDVAKKVNLFEDDLILYGKDKAKICKKVTRNDNSNLILVTAISPTPFGEGKTTVSIGLNDALCKLGKKSMAVLREPSMGPVFGMKGGATGGGRCQVVPMDEINLHFTGDFHAIEAANNLLCAAIDNHIFQGNELDINEVVFNRCLDVNDRGLRNVLLEGRKESFSITAASEVMAIFCLASSLTDLRERLGNILIGYNSQGKMIYARDLNVHGAMTVLLKDAFLPNLVQSLEGNPVIIHGGPFANIAHGCNSLVATNTGLGLADYVVTEAGFGADLGAEKFLNIKCRVGELKPKCVVLVATMKALKYHGGVKKENIFDNNMDAVVLGMANLVKHYNNLKKFGVNVVVCLNKYDTDIAEELDYIFNYCQENSIPISLNDAYSLGGDGAIDLAQKVLDNCNSESFFHVLYNNENSIKEKIDILCKEIYGASNVIYSEEANEKIERLEIKSYLPICVAKTQYSFSDDAKKIGVPTDFSMFVKDIRLYNGASFITVMLGNIMVMPGLPKKPNYEVIDLVDEKVVGVD